MLLRQIVRNLQSECSAKEELSKYLALVTNTANAKQAEQIIQGLKSSAEKKSGFDLIIYAYLLEHGVPNRLKKNEQDALRLYEASYNSAPLDKIDLLPKKSQEYIAYARQARDALRTKLENDKNQLVNKAKCNCAHVLLNSQILEEQRLGMQLLKELVADNDVSALYRYATLLKEGMTGVVDKNLKEATDYYLKCYSQGKKSSDSSLKSLGEHAKEVWYALLQKNGNQECKIQPIDHGKKIKIDQEGLTSFFESLVKKNESEKVDAIIEGLVSLQDAALIKLCGALYHEGMNGFPNKSKGIKYYKIAAELGYIEAKMLWAVHELLESSCLENQKKGVDFFLEAATSGEYTAQKYIACLYKVGIKDVLQVNENDAAYWEKKSVNTALNKKFSKQFTQGCDQFVCEHIKNKVPNIIKKMGEEKNISSQKKKKKSKEVLLEKTTDKKLTSSSEDIVLPVVLTSVESKAVKEDSSKQPTIVTSSINTDATIETIEIKSEVEVKPIVDNNKAKNGFNLLPTLFSYLNISTEEIKKEVTKVETAATTSKTDVPVIITQSTLKQSKSDNVPLIETQATLVQIDASTPKETLISERVALKLEAITILKQKPHAILEMFLQNQSIVDPDLCSFIQEELRSIIKKELHEEGSVEYDLSLTKLFSDRLSFIKYLKVLEEFHLKDVFVPDIGETGFIEEWFAQSEILAMYPDDFENIQNIITALCAHSFRESSDMMNRPADYLYKILESKTAEIFDITFVSNESLLYFQDMIVFAQLQQKQLLSQSKLLSTNNMFFQATTSDKKEEVASAYVKK